MCLLTCFAPGVQPDITTLTQGADHNPDGHGWALIADGQILTDRGMDADTVIEQFRLARLEYPESHAIFHSRIGTAGLKDESNCHPFPTGPSSRTGNPLTFMAHNGILPSSAQPPKGDPRSDTRLFADQIMPQKFFHLDSRKTRRRLESWLGSYNKIAVLTVDPAYQENFYLFNESSGEWKSGIWYSNQNHCWSPSSYAYYWPSKGEANSMRAWWKDANGEYDYPDDDSYTIGPRTPGVWVSNGREGATFLPSTSATAKELEGRVEKLLQSAREGDYFDKFICTVCRVLGRIRRDNRVCDYCRSCDLCHEPAKECECEAGQLRVLTDSDATEGKQGFSFRPANHGDLFEHFSEDEVDALSDDFIESYSDFLAEQDEKDEAERFGL